MDLTDAQWKILQPLMIEPDPREDGKGRPRSEARSILNGILWILRTDVQWKDLRIVIRLIKLVIVVFKNGIEMERCEK
ncbi:transposase [Leptospira noguchii]|nr:transposase [Leptospira noguchii]